MSVSNSHQMSEYYDFFRDKEIIFSKSNLRALRIDPRQIYVKCNGGQWPCIINSTSLQMATIIIGTSSGAYKEFSGKNIGPVSLRYCFIDQSNQPIQFFVNCSVQELKPYQGSAELALVTLNFTQRPPDDLISRVGEFLQVNENFKRKLNEPIVLNKESLRELGIPKEESYIFIANVPRKCILKELSFGGAKLLFVGIPKFLENKPGDLKLLFIDTNEKISIPCIIKSAVFLPNRKDIVYVVLEFIPEDIPMTYKFHINSYLTSYQKHMIDKQILNKQAQAKAEAEEAAKASAIKEKMEAMKQKADSVKDKVSEAVTDKVEDIKEKATEIKSEIKEKKDEIKQSVSDKIEEVKDKIEEKKEEVESKIQNS